MKREHITDPLAEEIKEYIDSRGTSIVNFAGRCGISRMTIYNIVQGKTVASRETELKIREVLDESKQ